MRWLLNSKGLYESPFPEVVADQLAKTKGNQVFWLDVEDPDQSDFVLLRDVFGFHALTLEQIRRPFRRPEISDYHDYTYLDVAQGDWQGGAVELRNLNFFINRNYVVSVHLKPEPAFDGLRARLKDDPRLAEEKPAFLQFLVLDQLVDRNFELLDAAEEVINRLERQIIVRPTRRSMGEIYDLKQRVTDLGKTLGAQREVFQHLITHSIDPGDTSLVIYYRDIHEHIVRQHETADSLRDLCSSVMEVYLSGSSNRLNVTMKQLTMITAFFLPLSAITGFFGMNHAYLVDHIGSYESFVLTVGGMSVTELLMVLFFWRAGWFS